MRARAVIQVPYLDEDVHDLAGLMQINEYLFAGGRQASERRSQLGSEPAPRVRAQRSIPGRSPRSGTVPG